MDDHPKTTGFGIWTPITCDFDDTFYHEPSQIDAYSQPLQVAHDDGAGEGKQRTSVVLILGEDSSILWDIHHDIMS